MARAAKKQLDSATALQGINIPEQRMLALSEVNMDPLNPRIMPPEKMASLRASLIKHGLVLNLVVQKKGLVLIGGHQRVTAMRALCKEKGWREPEKLPSVILDIDDAQARQLNVSLNNIEGEFDPFKLGAYYADIRPHMTMDDVLASGFTAEQIDEAVLLTRSPDELAAQLEDGADGLGGFAASITLSVEFDTVKQRDEAKELLRNAAANTKRKPGSLFLEALKASNVTRPRHKKTDAKVEPKKKSKAA